MKIIVRNHSTLVSGSDARAMVAACSIQLTRDLAPAWNRAIPYLALATDDQPGSDALVDILDDPDQADAYGYHEEQGDKVYAKVFAKPVLQNGGAVLLSKKKPSGCHGLVGAVARAVRARRRPVRLVVGRRAHDPPGQPVRPRVSGPGPGAVVSGVSGDGVELRVAKVVRPGGAEHQGPVRPHEGAGQAVHAREGRVHDRAWRTGQRIGGVRGRGSAGVADAGAEGREGSKRKKNRRKMKYRLTLADGSVALLETIEQDGAWSANVSIPAKGPLPVMGWCPSESWVIASVQYLLVVDHDLPHVVRCEKEEATT